MSTEWIVSSSVLIAVIVLLRHLLKGRLSLRLQYALWALVLVRLLVPVSFGSSSISVLNPIEQLEQYQEIADTPLIQMPRPEYNGGANTVPTKPDPQDSLLPDKDATIEHTPQTSPDNTQAPPAQEIATDHKLELQAVLRSVWLGGGILLGAWFLLTNLRLAAKLRYCRNALTTAYKLPVYLCDAVDTPCLFGFFRPAVYLTAEVASDERITRHALEHELTHYRHLDHIWAILRCACLAVHWYNPLVWCAAILSRNDAELACDESTIRRLGESERAEYGRTLLHLTCEKHTAIMTTATTMTGSSKTIKERISLIVHKPKMAIYTLIAVIIIASIAIGCTFTGAKNDRNEIELWPEDAAISCARFEYAGDNGGYKLITSEIAQFNSLRNMNLIPAEGELTDDVIYRLILNWNGIATEAEEYIILVGENSLSVNGQLYQPDGFDFSEILSYFEGKYEYFDYELLFDTKPNNATAQPDELLDDLSFVLRRLETLTAQDIKSTSTIAITGHTVTGGETVDTAELAPLLNAASQSAMDYRYDLSENWELVLNLSDDTDKQNGIEEEMFLQIGFREYYTNVSYHMENQQTGIHISFCLRDASLYRYIRGLFLSDAPVDEAALAEFEDILTARAQQTMDQHNAICEQYNLPAFTGFEIASLRLIDGLRYSIYNYEIYAWDPAFFTDASNPEQYGWPQAAYADEQGRIRAYEQCGYFVAAWFHDDLEYEFFNDDLYIVSQGRAYTHIVERFEGYSLYLRGSREGRSDIYTVDGVTLAIPDTFCNLAEFHRGGSGAAWCEGVLVNPTYYLDNHYVTDQTLFGLYHACDYWDDGLGWICSIQRYNEEEYEQFYLYSSARQSVFARDEDYYYCVLLPTDVQFSDPETAAIIEELRNEQLGNILDDMIARNGWQACSGEADKIIQIRNVSVVPEEYREIIAQRAEETLKVHNALCKSMEAQEQEYGLTGFYQPLFNGFEVLSFDLQDSFSDNGTEYDIYYCEIVFHTDDPNADQGTWSGDPFVDEQNRVHDYDEFTYFVVYRENEQMEWDFFHSDLYELYSDSKEQLFDHIAQWLSGEVVTLPILTLSDEENDAVCTAVLNDLKTGWWTGIPLADCAYEAGAFECVYRETKDGAEYFYGYGGYFRFDDNGYCVDHWYAASIVTMDTETKQVYEVWWPGDGAYHEMDILEKFPDEIAEFVAEPDSERSQVIRERLEELAKNNLEN